MIKDKTVGIYYIFYIMNYNLYSNETTLNKLKVLENCYETRCKDCSINQNDKL